MSLILGELQLLVIYNCWEFRIGGNLQILQGFRCLCAGLLRSKCIKKRF